MKQIPIKELDFCVYKITNSISDKSYIGKTKNLENRWKEHLNGSKNIENDYKFPRAIRKYPEDSWDIFILYETNDENHSYEVEALLVDEYNTFKFGYNSCGGGDGLGSGENHPCFGKTWKLSQEQIEARSGENSPRFGKRWKMTKKQKDARSGENNPNFGNKWSQEQIEARSGINHPNFGKTWSQEQIEARSGINHPCFGKTWKLSQEQIDARSGENSPRFGIIPWDTPSCKSKNLEINWFYLDKVYDLRIKYKYGPKRMFETLIPDYPDIKKSPTSFQNMFRWIEKNGNPIKNKDWLDFHDKF